MLRNIKVNKKGFTIVETLIVLAIAAVIIIIVLLAVPALQRTSRNTNIKNNATAISAAISDFASNNSGSLPGVMSAGNPIPAANNGDLYFCTSGACTNATAGAKATVQPTDKVFFTVLAANGTTPIYGTAGYNAQKIGVNVISIFAGGVCPTSAAPTVITYSASQTAIFYPDETGSANGNVECLQA